MVPLSSSGIRPARTSEDLPLPEVPTTATNRFFAKARCELGGLFVAAEKEMIVAKLKGAQAGEMDF